MSSSSNSTIASEVLAASLGGAISASILYPLEVLKTKMQADNNSDDDDEEQNTTTDANKTKTTSMISYAKHLYQKQGISVFLTGIEYSALQSAVEKALYFFAYEGLKAVYINMTKQSSSSISPFASLSLGCAAEWAHLPITLPLDCWTTNIQTNKDSSKTAMALLLSMLSEKGPAGMYKGIEAYVVLCFKPALQYMIFEQVKGVVVKNRPPYKQHLSAAEAFLLGMVARTIATIITFPYVRAKVVLQTQQNDNNTTKQTIPTLLAQMYQKNGITSWYQGIAPELTRGVLSSALMLMIKEKVAQLVQGMLLVRKENRQHGGSLQ